MFNSDGTRGRRIPVTNTATSLFFMDAEEYSGRICTVETYRKVPPEKMRRRATHRPSSAPDSERRKYVSNALTGATQENHKMV